MLKHQDDDGDLSIVAGKDQLIFACNRGHYWVVDSVQRTMPADADTGHAEGNDADLKDSLGPLKDSLGPQSREDSAATTDLPVRPSRVPRPAHHSR